MEDFEKANVELKAKISEYNTENESLKELRIQLLIILSKYEREIERRRILFGEESETQPVNSEPQAESVNEAFATYGVLRAHKRTHIDERPYKCVYCEYSSSRQYNLRVHIRKHTGEKPYKCDFENCDYVTAYRDRLSAHKKTQHSDEKPFKCDQCDFATKEKRYLKSHLLTHTGEKPHKCDQCDFSASLNNTLRYGQEIYYGFNLCSS